MAKDRKTDFSSLVSKAPTNKVDAEEAIKEIHGKKESPKLKRTTLDIPVDLHAKIKIHCFKQGITVKEFFLGLAKEYFK